MMYFVQRMQTYSPKNRACKELLDFIQKFERVLIKDETSLDAMAEEIRLRIQEINTEHPKLKKKIRFSFGSISDGVHRIDATVDNMGCSDYVFFMDICKVRRVYQFSEQVNTPKKSIPTPGTCRVCGCTENNPCFNPGIGMCWWADEEHTICSHCANPDIKDNPETVHGINTNKGV